MGVIPLKIQGKMLAVGSTSHHRMQGTKRLLEQLMRHRGLRSVRNSYETHEATFLRVKIRKMYGINYPKSKPHFFSSDKRGKNGVLRGYYKDKGPRNICWALCLVREHFAIRGQTNGNEYVRLRTP